MVVSVELSMVHSRCFEVVMGDDDDESDVVDGFVVPMVDFFDVRSSIRKVSHSYAWTP